MESSSESEEFFRNTFSMKSLNPCDFQNIELGKIRSPLVKITFDIVQKKLNACDAWFALFFLWNTHFIFVQSSRCCFYCSWNLIRSTLKKKLLRKELLLFMMHTPLRHLPRGTSNTCSLIFCILSYSRLCCTIVLKRCIVPLCPLISCGTPSTSYTFFDSSASLHLIPVFFIRGNTNMHLKVLIKYPFPPFIV